MPHVSGKVKRMFRGSNVYTHPVSGEEHRTYTRVYQTAGMCRNMNTRNKGDVYRIYDDLTGGVVECAYDRSEVEYADMDWKLL